MTVRVWKANGNAAFPVKKTRKPSASGWAWRSSPLRSEELSSHLMDPTHFSFISVFLFQKQFTLVLQMDFIIFVSVLFLPLDLRSFIFLSQTTSTTNTFFSDEGKFQKNFTTSPQTSTLPKSDGKCQFIFGKKGFF